MSRDCTFTRPIIKMPTSKCPKVTVAWWVIILDYINKHPGCTVRQCNKALAPRWDRFATNVWADAIRQKLIEKKRNGRQFHYFCTALGTDKIERVLKLFK